MTLTTKVKSLLARKESKNLLSIALSHSDISYCYSSIDTGLEYKLLSVVNEDAVNALNALHNVDGLTARCELILSSKLYQIVQIDKPKIPENELLAGLKWQVKDLVTIPSDDMVLDYFDGPSLAGVNKINVVCAHQSKIKAMVTALHKDSLTLKSITTEEFAFA